MFLGKRCVKVGKTLDGTKSECGSERFTWAFQVDVGPPGGRRDQRIRAGFKTKAAAVEAMAKMQKEIADHTHVEPSRLTVGRYLLQWLEAGSWSGNATRDYRVAIERHINPRIGDVPLQALTTVQIRGLYSHLARNGLVRERKADDGTTTKTEGPLSPKSIHNVHICLRSALNAAIEDRLLPANPALKAHTFSRTKHRPEMKTWTAEEVRRFLNFTVQDRGGALYRIALMTGLRRGELLGLRRRELDLDAGRLHVRQQYTRDGDRGLKFKGLKTGSNAWRTVDLDPTTVAALRGHLAAQEFERRSWGDAYCRDLDLVFCHPDGSPLDPDEATRRFERRSGEAGVLVIRLHDARHTHATLLLENGESLKYVAERLGDREDTVLQVYQHVTAKTRAQAPSRLAALIDLGDECDRVVIAL